MRHPTRSGARRRRAGQADHRAHTEERAPGVSVRLRRLAGILTIEPRTCGVMREHTVCGPGISAAWPFVQGGEGKRRAEEASGRGALRVNSSVSSSVQTWLTRGVSAGERPIGKHASPCTSMSVSCALRYAAAEPTSARP